MQRINYSSKPLVKNSAAGAGMVEVAMSVFTFIVIALFTIDLGRYLFARAVLSYAAHEALDLATKMPIDVVTTQSYCNTDGRTQTECAQFNSSLAAIYLAGRRMAQTVAGPSGSGRGVELVDLDMFFESVPDSILPLSTNSIGFLRPGEKLRENLQPSSIYDHPTRSFSSGWPAVGETWATVLEDNPLVVKIRANFKPITPLIPEIRIDVEQLGFSRSRRYGKAYPRASSSPTVIPTISATPSPTPVGGETPLPTSTATRTPTRSPTPNCGCCISSPPQCCSEYPLSPSCGAGAGFSWCSSHCFGDQN